jgi:hypothetical protein
MTQAVYSPVSQRRESLLSQASLCGICGEQCGSDTGFVPSTSVFFLSLLSDWCSMFIFLSVSHRRYV